MNNEDTVVLTICIERVFLARRVLSLRFPLRFDRLALARLFVPSTNKKQKRMLTNI